VAERLQRLPGGADVGVAPGQASGICERYRHASVFANSRANSKKAILRRRFERRILHLSQKDRLL
jgi:hypothetical protein